MDQAVVLQGKQYALPDRNIVTRFINILAEEIKKCNEKKQASEKEFIFMTLVLQRNKLLWKGKDILPLLMRRMDMRGAGKIQELLIEAQQCNHQLQASIGLTSHEQVKRIFN